MIRQNENQLPGKHPYRPFEINPHLKGQCYERRENSSNCKDPYEKNGIILKIKITLKGAYFLDS